MILCEKAWGLGRVMVGGMTTANYHSPSPQGTNFRANLFTYLNSLAVATACTVSQDVEVFANPTVTASVDDSEICEGESVIFTGGGTDDYAWDMGVTDGVAFTPAGIGTVTYTVTGTNATTTCQNTATVDVTVHPNPTVTASVDASEICLGDAVTFTGGGADSYTWDLGVTNGVPFTPAALGTTTYTVVGTTTATGCQNTATIDVTVFDNPVVTATATPDVICIGESIVFTGGGADSYIWDGGITDGVAYTPPISGTFTFNVIGLIDVIGCQDTAAIIITIYDLPSVGGVADDYTICEGASVTLNGTGASSYSWDLGVIDGVPFSPLSTGIITYTVIGTDAEGCTNTASVDIEVYENPTTTASASETTICLGESVILTGGGADSYSWDAGIINGIAFYPSTVGSHSYSVTGTSDEGCSSSSTITIEVIECEDVIADFTSKTSICLGDCITFNDESMGTIASWAWDFGGAADPLISTLQNPTVCFNSIGTFPVTLTITNINGTTSSITKNIIVNAYPDLFAKNDTIIDLGGTANLIANSSYDGTFTWSPDSFIDCTTCEITTASPLDSTVYTVVFLADNGCSSSAQVMVLVNTANGVGVPSAFSPNGDGFNDVLFVKGYGIDAINFTIYNRYGEVVFFTTDQSIGWDGTFKNQEENPGVFTWVLNYNL